MPIFQYSEAGHNHLNQDRIAVQRHPHDSGLWIWVLADGQGGQAGGERAAQTAVNSCLEWARQTEPRHLKNEKFWLEIVRAADKKTNQDFGFTTLIALCADETQICGASVGDSMALWVGPHRERELSLRQRKNPPIGSGEAIPVAFSQRWRSGENLVLMSDGVWRYLGIETIAQLCRQHWSESLAMGLRQKQTENNGGILADDFSLIWGVND